MSEQIYWEDVKVGAEMPPLSKVATSQMLVKWAGASGDFNPLHYEDDFAASQGVGKPIVHGELKRAWLVHFVTAWMGVEGTLTKLACQYRAMDYPRKMKSMQEPMEGDTWRCKGKITNKYTKDGEHYVDCEIWVENAKGEKTTPGSATVVLPAKRA